jgi:hypothetical protein
VTLGGYVAAESVFRQRNEVADLGAIFNAIPYPFSPLYREHEFHASARGSRPSLLAEGNIDSAHHLAAYFEMDVLGVGEISNYTESNSWSPRLRQAYLTYDDSDRGGTDNPDSQGFLCVRGRSTKEVFAYPLRLL